MLDADIFDLPFFFLLLSRIYFLPENSATMILIDETKSRFGERSITAAKGENM